MLFKIAKSKICLRPSNMFCLFIEIYCNIVEAILKYYWIVLNVIWMNLHQILFLKYVFNLTAETNGKYSISKKNHLKCQKTGS